MSYLGGGVDDGGGVDLEEGAHLGLDPLRVGRGQVHLVKITSLFTFQLNKVFRIHFSCLGEIKCFVINKGNHFFLRITT